MGDISTSEMAKAVDVIIVGAGLSGLQAATDCHGAGLTTLVLEAKDRVGGKTCSVSNGRGGTVDVGAAWINDTTQRRMFALSQKFGIDVVMQRAVGEDIVQNDDGTVEMVPYGEYRLTKDETKELETFFEVIDGMGDKLDPEDPSTLANAAELDSMTLTQYCNKYMPGKVAPLMANGTARGFLGVEADEISALFYIDYVRSGFRLESLTSDLKGGAQYLRARQGWQTISKRLAADLPPSSVLLSTPVAAIHQSESGDCIVYSDSTKSTFRSKHVIISIPTPLYKHIEFYPALPARKLAVTSSTHLGHTSKMILIYDAPWWRDVGLSGVLNSSIGPLAFSRDSSVEADNQYSLTCFLVGEPARKWALLPLADRKSTFLEHVKVMFAPVVAKTGKPVPAPVDTIEQIWAHEPWIWGCPCPVTALGSLAEGAAKIRREAWGKIHFVGSETSVDYQGYMEGALSAGERGAAEVIAAVNTT
ncbi:hypothetical protein BP5796_12701 [Coleophoma crateriformis]|uniref:Amine oxidase n=1 Tax=Coleophoma crateriformis TaxID=565419 RepID=A0A3D8Q612_9HELO|nr:hypothetical protein BP5796_12701 [Coleophoma crateriformis]